MVTKREGLIYKIRHNSDAGHKVYRVRVRFESGPEFSAELCIFCVDEFSVVCVAPLCKIGYAVN